MQTEILNRLKSGTENAVKALKDQLSKVRTGKANVALLDGVMVNYYGTPTPLKQVANLATPEPRLIQIQAWEKNLLPEIEKAIIAANLGLHPQNDGKIVRLPIPALTEERRKDLVKQAKKLGEDCKIAIRNQRRDANEAVKKAEKDREMSEDDAKRATESVQKMTDDLVKEVDKVITAKEQEILTI